MYIFVNMIEKELRKEQIESMSWLSKLLYYVGIFNFKHTKQESGTYKYTQRVYNPWNPLSYPIFFVIFLISVFLDGWIETVNGIWSLWKFK